MENEIVLFESEDDQVKLNVEFDGETVWLTKEQMAALFGRDRSVISRHISNIFREGEILEEGNVHYLHIANSDKPVAFYNLDAIISVAYRVKSKRGVEFRRWATGVLRQYVLDGYAANKRRLAQLGQIVQVMDRIPSSLEARDILSVVKAYTGALDLLDDYDHRRIAKPKGRAATYVLNYDECRSLIASMKFSRDSDLFGVEKDDSFRSSIAAIYQGFGGQEMYPTLEEKAANLLYFVVKNHSFHDGNKRIAAALFLYFLNMNDALWADGAKRISDSALVALTIMTAESKPDEKEAMVALAMSFLSLGQCVAHGGKSKMGRGTHPIGRGPRVVCGVQFGQFCPFRCTRV